MNIRLEGGPRCGELTSLDRPAERVTYGLHREWLTFYFVYEDAGYTDSKGAAVFRHTSSEAVNLRLPLWKRILRWKTRKQHEVA